MNAGKTGKSHKTAKNSKLTVTKMIRILNLVQKNNSQTNL